MKESMQIVLLSYFTFTNAYMKKNQWLSSSSRVISQKKPGHCPDPTTWASGLLKSRCGSRCSYLCWILCSKLSNIIYSVKKNAPPVFGESSSVVTSNYFQVTSELCTEFLNMYWEMFYYVHMLCFFPNNYGHPPSWLIFSLKIPLLARSIEMMQQ